MKIRKRVITQPLIELTGSQGYPLTNRALVLNPSSRLRCTVEVFFDFQTSGTVGPDSITNYNGTWTLRAKTPGVAARGTPYLHYLIGPSDPLVDRELPHSYNFMGSIESVEVSINLTANPSYGTSGSIGVGLWALRAIWEPDTMAQVDDLELQYLLDQCGVVASLLRAT